MGTDEDPAIIVAKIPVIAVGEPENLIKHISMPLKLQQHAWDMSMIPTCSHHSKSRSQASGVQSVSPR